MAKVKLHGIHKSFEGTSVLKGITTDIADGSFAVIVGASGCGKSTLLRMLAGLETPDIGEIYIGDRNVVDIAPGDRDVAMVFQNYALYPHLSVAENIGFGLSVRGVARSEIRERVRKTAQSLQIDHLLERRPRQLSGGQRQRVAMGRAIVRNPKVFLFDEPLSNLDAKLRIAMRIEIKRLHRELGVTSVYVTHDQVEAMTLGDKLIVMNQGRIEQEGSPLEIYAHPATSYVAAFIGSPPMNLLDVQCNGQGLRFDNADSISLSVPENLPNKIRFGIRPEHLQPCGELDACFRLLADIVEPQGSETIVHGTVGNQAIVARLPGIAKARAGEAIPMRFEHKLAHFF